MEAGEEELERLLENALALHEEVLLRGREELPEESLGFVYGRKAGERMLRKILEGIPREASSRDQAAYLIRAIVCAQIFNEGNKRLATVFTNFWLRRDGLRLRADPDDLRAFMYRVVSACPKIPLPQVELQVKDGLYESIRAWLEDSIGTVKRQS